MTFGLAGADLAVPNVVEAYKAFKDKGFGIVGVSLDENADKWKEAITALNITWPQMSDLQGWNNAGAKLYGVNSIPATVLVDQEGTIEHVISAAMPSSPS